MMTAAILTSTNSLRAMRKLLFAKKLWLVAQSKPSVATEPSNLF
jgi:hypothetical protein